MKSTYNNTLNILTALVSVIFIYSCADDTFEQDRISRLPDNMIRFEVSSGFDVSAHSRSEETDDDAELSPVAISQGSDTLYIHRYVAPEYERTPGRNSFTQSRGVQINDNNKFKEFCKKFYVKARYFSDSQTYIPLSQAEPLNDDAGTWYIKDPHYYWPVKKELIFNAFAPADAIALLPSDIDDILDSETITFAYTVPFSEDGTNDAEVQPDLMFASTKCSRSSSTDNIATLKFRHALSAIKFAVRDVANGEIVNITVDGVAGSGTGTFNTDAESAPAFTWSNLGEKSSYTQKFSYKTTEKEYDKIPQLDDAPVINDQEGMNAKTFMLIPQEISENAELIITFKKDGEETPKILKGKLKTVDIPKWEAGKEYIYTISTSADVWEYHFEVKGSVQEENDETPAAGEFVPDDNNIIINATVTDGAYYNVKSYRVRKSNPNIIQAVAWSAKSSDGVNNNSTNSKIQEYITAYKTQIPMKASPLDWFPEIGITAPESENLEMDGNGNFGDSGSEDSKQYYVKFKTQYVATDWNGDWDMRGKTEIGSQDDPVDLSYNNCGGSQTTANCYVVNRGGWFKFPLVYGNAISKGENNTGSYKFEGGTVNVSTNGGSWSYYPLSKFTDYKGDPIEKPCIDGAQSVKLVWQDAYNIIDDIQIKNNEVWFHVARADLQQSNSVIAVCDQEGKIIWSWHIWVNEYMVDDNQKLVGGIECETWNADDQSAGYGPFELAQRNLGWCDPKNVEYLKRTGTITFKQAGGKTPDKTLNVTQRGKVIEFFIGNNTYYQWGRKDPMVGFRYSTGSVHYVKYNFGEIGYGFKDYTNATIADGIQNPSMLLAGTAGTDRCNWIANHEHHYYNLWNNYHNEDDRYLQKNSGEEYNEVESGTATPLPTLDYAYSAVKTIYDPSPAGFVVPPQKFFELLTKGQNEHKYIQEIDMYGKPDLSGVFNGYRVEKNSYYQYNAYPKRDGSGEATILLTGTGQRWHRSGSEYWPMGGNMNPNHVYLWPNSIAFCYKDEVDNGLTLAIGLEGKYISTNRMLGRKSMARPVRSVKEYTPKTLGR